MASYIRVRTNGVSNPQGYKLEFSNLVSSDRQIGVDTFDLSLPNTDFRSLVPSSGNKRDLNYEFELIDDSTSKGVSINNIGNENPVSNSITTAEQINFLEDEIFRGSIGIVFELHDEWLNKTYFGWATLNLKPQEEENFSVVRGNIVFKVGGNPFSI